jgi:threonine dehydrogenase-like Zn-dependent dehydrogenase
VTGGTGADVVVEASAVATQPVTDAIKAVRKDGRIVLIGLKRGEPIPGLVTDELIYKGVTVIGAMAANYSAFEQAIHTLAGDVPGADAIGVSIEPGRA